MLFILLSFIASFLKCWLDHVVLGWHCALLILPSIRGITVFPFFCRGRGKLDVSLGFSPSLCACLFCVRRRRSHLAM